jgi:3D (Asp-Asp-Asp) domain-containing protein
MKKDLFYLFLIGLLIGTNIYKDSVEAEIKAINGAGGTDAVTIVSDTVYIVTATVYHAVESQCDSDCLVTASGAAIRSADSAYEHRYLAVSRDLLDVFPYGTRVEVSGCGELDGEWIVSDTMNKRYKGYVDLLINPDMKGGKWSGVRIRKVSKK